MVYRRDRALTATLKEFSLLATEWRTLGTLLRKGPLTMQELAQWTAYDRTSLTRMLTSMEARNWVKRLASESDGRSVVVQIAPKGARLYRRAERAVDALTAEIMQVCPQVEIGRVRHSLQAMRAKLIDMSY